MPVLPNLKRLSHPKFATVTLVMGLATGMMGFAWRWQSLRDAPQATPTPDPPIDQVMVPGFPNPLRRLPNLTTRSAPPLEIPPFLLPQPLPPDAVWPEVPSQQPRPYFSDSADVAWATPILEDLAQRRFIKGFPDGTFRPNTPMTRAEFATQLSRLFVLSAQTAPALGYTDVDPSHWAIHHIQSAIDRGFLTGYPDQTFRPEENITRLQVMLALANGLNLQSSSSPDRVLQDYLDADQVPPWARTALITTLEANLMVNYPNPKRLEPNRDATRAEVVAMLRQTLVYMGQLEPLLPGQTPPPDQPAY